MSKDYQLKGGKIEEKVVNTYKTIEHAVVDTYQSVEDAVVDAYQKIEDKFVETFLEEKKSSKNADLP